LRAISRQLRRAPFAARATRSHPPSWRCQAPLRGAGLFFPPSRLSSRPREHRCSDEGATSTFPKAAISPGRRWCRHYHFCAHSTHRPSSLRQPSQWARRQSRHSWINTTSSLSLLMPHATQVNSPAIAIPPWCGNGLHGPFAVCSWSHTGGNLSPLLDSLGTTLLPFRDKSCYLQTWLPSPLGF
jgi:hypothetical protein